MAPLRSSTRLSGARVKYTDDPFRAAGLSDEGSSSSEEVTNKKSRRKGNKGKNVAKDDSDEEFADIPRNDGASEEEEEEEEEQDDADADASEDDHGIPGDTKSRAKIREKLMKRPRKIKELRVDDQESPNETHFRGVWGSMDTLTKPISMRLTFGTDSRDLLAVLYGTDLWHRGVDAALPSRASLDRAAIITDYGYGKSFGLEPEQMTIERTRAWDWYYDPHIGGTLRQKQQIERIDDDEVRRTYMPLPKKDKHTIIIGPADSQVVFKVGQNESVDFGEAWEKSKPEGEGNSNPSSQSPDGEAKRKAREGWILNIGSKIQCLDWAPNQEGLDQYLAISAPISDEQKKHYSNPVEAKTAPSFTPSPPYPHVLQVWAFKARPDDGLTKTLDTGFKPIRRLALCTNWGDLRRMSWCPAARDPREEDEEETRSNIGLIAGIWGDGYVRVLDVSISKASGASEFCK